MNSKFKFQIYLDNSTNAYLYDIKRRYLPIYCNLVTVCLLPMDFLFAYKHSDLNIHGYGNNKTLSGLDTIRKIPLRDQRLPTCRWLLLLLR